MVSEFCELKKYISRLYSSLSNCLTASAVFLRPEVLHEQFVAIKVDLLTESCRQYELGGVYLNFFLVKLLTDHLIAGT